MKIYNTLSRKKEEFAPLHGKTVKIYSCGPTVYNYIHIGNARPMVMFDTVSRYLSYKGYDVIHVQNFTDVDDKIINKGLEENVPAGEIARRFIAEALADEERLNVRPPAHRPKVTEEMDAIVGMIATLTEKGFAYEKNGSVYYDTGAFPGYGKLSGKNISELEAGARVEVDAEKRSPSDFVLWKPAKPGEPKWPSPWGEGRPGWHIECSAMIKRYLGDSIDIHTGGEDLIFPHHENEIAQSEAATGATLAKYWMHNGFLNVDNKKMSKSAGNFFTLREITETVPYDVVRFFIVSAHYRMPVNFSAELLQAAENALNRIKNGVENLRRAVDFNARGEWTDEERALAARARKFTEDFERSMDDDFNTADAVTAIFDFVKFTNIHVNDASSTAFARRMMDELTALTDILGLRLGARGEAGGSAPNEAPDAAPDEELIKSKIAEREAARKAKDYALADAIRAELASMGVELLDTAAGARWSFK